MHAFAVAGALLALAAPGWKPLLAKLEDERIDVYPCSTDRAALAHAPPGSASCLAEAPAEARNHLADGVAAVLAIVAVILLVRRRRQLRKADAR